MRLVHISVGTRDSHMMDRAAAEMLPFGVEHICYDASELDSDPMLLNGMLDTVSSADLVTLKVHGDTSYFKRFDRLEKVLSDRGVSALLACTDASVTERYRCLFRGSDDEHALGILFMECGGDDNLVSLMKLMLRMGGADIDVPDPVYPPAQGIYRPGLEDIDIDRYVDSLDLSKPTVGIFFYQKQWVTGNMRHIDALIREVEVLGANAVPLFLYTSETRVPGARGTAAILRESLVRDGRPVLDSIIETMSFSQTLIADPGVGEQVSDDNFFLDYGVPVIQSMSCCRPADVWRDDINGLTASEIAYDIAHPEFDGQIISVACGSTERGPDGSFSIHPLDDRPRRVADTAVGWARLGHVPRGERRVAVLLYMYPPKTANAGGASGLDTFASVVDLLHRMRDDGYHLGDRIPETPKELVDLLLDGLTNDTEWMSDTAVRRSACDLIGPETYDAWYSKLSDGARARLEEGWGPPPGDICTVGGNITVPGIMFGNVFVGFQPDRGRNAQSDCHDPTTVMPHQYYAFYQWLRYVFGADALIHVGTHGTLEWLPGKSTALSSDCCPDYVLDSIPDIYPYIIGNPGEGIQAKRRAAAVIVDHMIPAMTRSGGYDGLDELEAAVQNYMGAVTQLQDDKRALIRERLREVVARMDMYDDLKLSPDCSDEEFDGRIDDLYDYVVDVKANLIKDGLHILGRVPEGRRLEETVYSMTRLDNGDVPSLLGSVTAAFGYTVPELRDRASETDPSSGRLKGQLLDEAEDMTSSLISDMAALSFDRDGCIGLVHRLFPEDDGRMEASVSFICDTLYPSICGTGREIDSIMDALDGRYVEPGPSGCPTRGRAQLLPTGRNFYSLDPDSIPWHSSWEIGRRMADQMLERYLEEHGVYPRSIGMVIWATDTMKTGGDDVAYILWLMGLRPVWTGYGGRVKDLEVIPVSELGRPRMDITLRISGLFRDTFPNLVEMFDRAVKRISDLDESDEDNMMRANVRRETAAAIAEGIPEDRARDEATMRIFGDAPGTYGSGTNVAIRTSGWKDVSDLGAIYRSYGEYAYGGGRKGRRSPEAFRRRLEAMDVTVKNSVSHEYDMFDNDDVYNDLGGLNAAVRSVSGRMPMSVIGSSADTSAPKLRTVDEEGRYIFRSKILNPKWVDGLKCHGFKGAEEISNMAEYVFAWSATSDIVDPWMFRSIAETFLLDGENSEWLRDANPYAMYETASWLLEAIGRGMWDADDDIRRRLGELYMELEGEFEGKERRDSP
ncbi:MAG: cobaltochelatase subunit CobN [Candidatus Methanomethylophilaceae archaeon]